MGYGFPGCPVVKNPSADSGEMGLIPGPRRFHMLRVNEAQGPQQEKPPQWEACTLQLEGSPLSLQLEKACLLHRRLKNK